MNYIENTFICLAAPLLLAILCLRRDARRYLIFLLAGMTACLFSAYVSAYAAGVAGADVAAASHEIAPAVEEIIKNEPKPAPKFLIDPDVRDFYAFTRDSFRMEGYEYSDFSGKIPVAV